MRKALALVSLAAVIRLFVIGAFELAPDEAYYLTWAMPSPPLHVDHPPVVRWMAELSWGLVHAGATLETAARIVPLLLSAATVVMLLGIAKRLGASDRALFVLAALASLLPLPAAGAILLTPDAPLCFAFALGLGAIVPVPGRRGVGLLVLACALAPLAKVSGYLLLPTVVLARHFAGMSRLGWRVMMLATVAALATLPLTYASLVFQGVHAFTRGGPVDAGLDAAPPFPGAGVPIFLLGQIALLLPATFLLDRPSARSLRAPLVAAAIPALPVLVSALVRVPEPNWTAPSYAGLLVALALMVDLLPADTAPFRIRVTMAATFGVAALLHVHLVHPILPFPPDRDATARLHGWRRYACEGATPPVTRLPPYAFPSERAVYRTTCPRSWN